MGMQLGHLLVLLYVTANALSVLGSAVAESPWRLLQKSSALDPIGPSQQPSILSDPAIAPKQAPARTGRKIYGHIGGASRQKASQISSLAEESPAKAPQPHNAIGSSSIAIAPSVASFGTPVKKWFLGPAHSPTVSGGKIPHGAGRSHIRIPKPSYPIPPPTYSHGGPSSSSVHSLSPSSRNLDSDAPALSPKNHFDMFINPPAVSPLHSSLKKFKAPPPSLILSLPPPPPNSDCTSVTCTEPLTYSPPGLPCGCVRPIQVKLRFSVPIYTFFTLVTELAKEIAASVSLNSSQVRIMGANAATRQLEKSIVLINLIPRGGKFNDTTALSIYTKFWGRQVLIKASLFGDYEVLYVLYPGLPPSPPSPLNIPSIIDRPYASSESNGWMNKPLGVQVPRRKGDGLGRGMIVAIALSSFTALVMCIGIMWFFLMKSGIHANNKSKKVQQDAVSSTAKPTAGKTETTIFGNMAPGSSVSFTAGALTYSGSAKTFSLSEIEEATNTFDTSRILGEGGFGVVYSGILDDGKEVAVKVLKRYDQHGSREFLAEVEMLSRLHHRNLVQLIGICTEGNVRCLVYELIPNGSVESHLHGAHKDTDPLDWDARMKIALGSARGLAYLHEDSNPRVIHRDFKSSNILLEHDFTPKVSDFGLARAAIDEGNKHISTHVMGTFGYLAPEYAMTGHLLVKSDVYSYGVVLLELLTGRKPVDLSQPPGQENLVAYVRPLLTGKESLEAIVDSEIKSTVSFDTLAKVAAIASMCVQPEVSHRPFMGEVVQALKLVCNEFDEAKIQDSSSRSLENLLIAEHSKKRTGSDETTKVLQSDFPEPLATSDLLSTSMGLEDQEFGSVKRHSTSGPLRTGRRKQFWQRLRSLSSGSTSDHGLSLKLWPGTS